MTTQATQNKARGDVTLWRALADGVRPRGRLSVSQWSDANRILSSKGASERGAWRTSRVPYLREIMDQLSDNATTQRVVVKKSTQVGLTEVGLNWIGYHIARALGPMLVVVPTLEVRKRWVLQRLAPMLSDTPALRDLSSGRKRDSANSEDIKDFPGALLVLSGANSGSSLRSMPIKHVLCDEVDDFPWEISGEGDPLGLIQRRTANFPRRKVLLISSPTIKGASRIDDEYIASDQRRYEVPCPECETYQPLIWKNVIWDRALTWARYACAHCGVEIAEHNKPRMLAAGRWVAQHPERSTRGYEINGLYAPIGLGLSWLEIAQDWRAAQGDVAKLKRFVNTALGECWEDERTRDLTAEGVAERAEPYVLRQVPPGCLVLTAGVDTQDDRLAVTLLGHGPGGQCWVLDWFEIPGQPGRPEIWQTLTEYVNTPLTNAYGQALEVEATAIDSGGHFTHEVYQYVRQRLIRRPMAIKGASSPGRPLLNRGSFVDVNARGRVIKKGVRVWLVGADTAKHLLYNRLASDEGHPAEDRSLHFSDGLSLDYYRQLTGEVFDPEKNKWTLRRGRRVEALDCWVYATAASQHPELRVHAKTAAAWQRLADVLEPGVAQVAEHAAPGPAKRKPRPPPLPSGVDL